MPMEMLERDTWYTGGTLGYRKWAQEAQEAIQSCRNTVIRYEGLVLIFEVCL